MAFSSKRGIGDQGNTDGSGGVRIFFLIKATLSAPTKTSGVTMPIIWPLSAM